MTRSRHRSPNGPFSKPLPLAGSTSPTWWSLNRCGDPRAGELPPGWRPCGPADPGPGRQGRSTAGAEFRPAIRQARGRGVARCRPTPGGRRVRSSSAHGVRPESGPHRQPPRMAVMNDSATSEIEPRISLARWLSVFSICLSVVFLAGVLTAALPPRLMDPQWQLSLVAALVNNAPVAVLAVLLLALAVWVHPASDRLRGRLRLFRRWALAACLGFLLLVPLQGYAAWRFYSTVTGQQQQQSSESTRRLADLRAAIASAASHQELQAAVQEIFGPGAGLSPQEFRTPMPELRRQLLAKAEAAAQQIMQQIEARTATTKPDLLLKDTVRLAVASVAYAVGFAFFCGVLPRTQRKGRSLGSQVDEEYFRSLAK
ncbi:MAG: hypothetical protein ER33_00950 [Cyanobium sp. CACIAM 14]|nr:MAG: hypothetical protein ER33_00950 [Cyanobium sp. CACIAM 14]